MKAGRIVAILVGVGLFFSAIPAVMADEVAASSPAIQYFGRWAGNDGCQECGQGACYIRTDFTGTSLRAELTGADGIWWRVSIDGGPFRRFQPQEQPVMLAEKLAPGRHSVLLVRSTEGAAGISTFRGFLVDDGAELLVSGQQRTRRLEFVGDSITAGAHNDGVRTAHYQDTENTDMAFGPVLARMLKADYSVEAKSGACVVRNYDEAWPWRGKHIRDYYDGTFIAPRPGAANPQWDARRFPVDGIILAVGTNDTTAGQISPVKPVFIAGYLQLLEKIRVQQPRVPIICMEPVPYRIRRDVCDWIQEAVRQRKASGDDQVYFAAVNEDGPLLAEDDFAQDWTHPVYSGAVKVAEHIRDRVAAILGWTESAA